MNPLSPEQLGYLISGITGYILFSLIPAMIAQRRGRSAGAFFLLALLLTPLLAALVALILPARELPQAVPSDRRPCPFCAELIKTQATVCHFCRQTVPAIPRYTKDAANGPSSSTSVALVVRCPQCRHNVGLRDSSASSFTCPHCRTVLEIS